MVAAAVLIIVIIISNLFHKPYWPFARMFLYVATATTTRAEEMGGAGTKSTGAQKSRRGHMATYVC